MVNVFECDFDNPTHTKALVLLMNHYMEDKMGDNPPLQGDDQRKLVDGLRNHPSKVVLLATYDDKFVGLINSFVNFGTFAVKPFINIHDVVVHTSCRGKGVGKALMNEIIAKAKSLDCGKITLEVREDNIVAQNLYKSVGFGEGNPVMHFWSKYF
ncbi:MAG: GNAT family N-acetyltransferase [Bacteroidales bacterium]|nr:GNAT family N-acetyltransferase [Bacteroidales bacterium]